MGNILSTRPYEYFLGYKKEETEATEDVEDVSKELKMEVRLDQLSTDAVESKLLDSNNRITFDAVLGIEEQLQLYEKVSLTFLLYENEDTALQALLAELENAKVQKTNNLIWNWARSKHTTVQSWQNQLLEALVVIQNYSVLQKLGYNRDELIAQFLPQYTETTLYLCKVRRVLYDLCESMTHKQAKLFLNKLRDDFDQKEIRFQNFDSQYLELYFLDFLSRKYIERNDFTNIIRIIKKMDVLDHKIEQLEKLTTKDALVRDFKLTKPQVKPTAEPSNQTCSDNSVIHENSLVRTHPIDKCYSIAPDHVGICLIINQQKFHRDSDPDLLLHLPINGDLKDRLGSEHDRDKLAETFQILGFRIVIRENRTHMEMKSAIEEVLNQFTAKDSCLVVCILSHGIRDAVYGVNSVPVDISEIEDILHYRKYKNLLGKPKVLVIQSCQGNPLQQVIPWKGSHNVMDGVEHDFQSFVPEKSDLLVCTSTVAGFASVRSERSGSWYIQELCKQIMEVHTTTHFTDILLSVTQNVSKLCWQKEGHLVCMVPQHRSTFRKCLYL